jgi:serpin B
MRKTNISLLFLSVTLLSPSFSMGAELDLGASNNAFTLSLYRNLASGAASEGIAVSPFSLRVALAMVYVGARENTAREMARTFYFGKIGEDGLKPLLEELRSVGSDRVGPELRISNAIWGQEKFPFLKTFLEINRKHYGGTIESADFATDPEAVRNHINQWASAQTEGKIDQLIKPGVLTPLTRMVLANAVYFKGTWADAFEPKRTIEVPFYGQRDNGAPDGKAKLMRRKGKLAYAEIDGGQAVEVPYAGGRLSLLILLPRMRGKDALASLRTKLDPAWLNGVVESLKPAEVDLGLPRFKLMFGTDAVERIESLGTKDLFNPDRANLTGMSEKGGLYVSHVLHRAFINVDETGTEAAAASAAVVSARAIMPIEKIPVVFRADHPFIWMIRERRTGAILFIGDLVRAN